MATFASRLRAIGSWQVTLFLALAALGFLVAAQLASEGPRVRYTTQERTPLVETVLGLQARQDELKAQILELRERIAELEAAGEGSAVLTRQLSADLEAARIAAGLVPLTGPGIVLQLEDSVAAVPGDPNDAPYLVSAADLLTVVEELWLAGAEAVAINGERVMPVTAIVEIGGSILVNSAYLAGPFQVSAIGPPDMVDRLTGSEGFVDLLRARAESYGIRVSLATPESVDIPAYAGSVNLMYSRPVPSPETE